MADDPPSPHGLAALVERETLRIVKQVKPEEPVPVADPSIAAALGQA